MRNNIKNSNNEQNSDPELYISTKDEQRYVKQLNHGLY